ncbi:hypothetical protein NDU88_002943 [Pleurodeles waltl]|uniref:Myb/SANT-like DNA-binding domain-containing protein n=1 Tax=Pleurodeles waltl TaxID=8319 RepID=A0AAV7M2I3_PLEWA|nr:hypothetical protein NDU88_002943 [Pleurodeles waltl]
MGSYPVWTAARTSRPTDEYTLGTMHVTSLHGDVCTSIVSFGEVVCVVVVYMVGGVMCVPMEMEMGFVDHMCDRLDCMCNGILLSVFPLQVSAHQKKGLWHAIAKDVRTLGVYSRWSTHCRKRWEDLRCWARKTAVAQLGMTSQRGRGTRRNLTPLMAHMLAVAYPELDGSLRASQQPQGSEYSGRYNYNW